MSGIVEAVGDYDRRREDRFEFSLGTAILASSHVE